MESKRRLTGTSTSVMLICLIILSIAVDSATAAKKCSCCVSNQAKACCFACMTAGGSDSLCKNTCCFPCFLTGSGAAANMESEMAALAKMEEVAAKMEEVAAAARMEGQR